MTVRATLAAAAAAAMLLAAGSASAQDRSTYVPAGLTSMFPTAHFVLHYNPATPLQYVQAGAADFEESYGRLVTGGVGVPNAGLKQPTADSDGKTDVYLAAPLDKPGFHGGTVYADSDSLKSSYMFMTPDLARGGFRFRSAHEFMHVIQDAYVFRIIDGIAEGFANWASEFALPDVDPLDNNFSGNESPNAPHPWVPLDCSYGTWEGAKCGNGYWQWMFVQAQVEDYGPDFATGYLERFASVVTTPDDEVIPLLNHEIGVQSGNAASLRTRFDAYARDVWDPTRWTTDAIRRLRDDEHQTPASFQYTVADRDSGLQHVAIDHLATRYVEILNYPLYADPGDLVELTWQRPAEMAGSVTPMIKHVGQEAWTQTGSYAANQGTVRVDLGPSVDEVVLPLVNDSLTADDQPYAYRVRLIEGPDTEAPQTRFRHHPPKRTSKRTAKFSFSGGKSFECKLDRKPFRPCTSPKKLRVKRGRHVFEVAATDAAGNTDPTPAKWKWKVTRR